MEPFDSPGDSSKNQRATKPIRTQRLSRARSSSSNSSIHDDAASRRLQQHVIVPCNPAQPRTFTSSGMASLPEDKIQTPTPQLPGPTTGSEGAHSADAEGETKAGKHRIRSMSFPASPVVTEDSYLESIPCPSPAASFLSKFAADPRLSTKGSFVLCENVILGNYLVGQIIGRGSMSECRDASALLSPNTYQEIHSPDSTRDTSYKEHDFIRVVLKIVRGAPGSPARAAFEKEVTIWRALRHPHILPLLDVFEIDDIKATVSPRADFGDLLSWIRQHGPMDESLCRLIFRQICSAVRYLHQEKHIYHRDIKLENILLHNGNHVYLTDFGLSEYFSDADPHVHSEAAHKMFDDTARSKPIRIGHHSMPSSPKIAEQQEFRSCPQSPSQSEEECTGAFAHEKEAVSYGAGSAWYCPPEEIVPEMQQGSIPCARPRKIYGPHGDIWSMGVVLYAMLTGSLPFLDEYFPRLQQAIQSGEYQELPDHISKEAKQLVRGMLTVDRNTRLSIEMVLAHEWFSIKDTPPNKEC